MGFLRKGSSKCFGFETISHKNVIALADIFPISCQQKDISVQHPYLQYILIHGTHKMPCSSSLPNHQHLQSDASNSDGSFVCKYCSNCVLFFVPDSVTEGVGRPTHLHLYFVQVTLPPSLDTLCSQNNRNIFYSTITK